MIELLYWLQVEIGASNSPYGHASLHGIEDISDELDLDILKSKILEKSCEITGTGPAALKPQNIFNLLSTLIESSRSSEGSTNAND